MHGRGGIRIPPAAPGFDARLVGGTSIVQRNGGATLREELDAAASSDPDALGLISWNEFSETRTWSRASGTDPGTSTWSPTSGGARLPQSGEFDSSEPSATGVNYGIPLLGAMALFLIASLGLILRPRLTLKR